MQDKYKTRFWDKKSNCWVYSMALSDCGFAIMQDGSDIESSGYNSSDILIDRCLGSKEKSGKLLFENDIVVQRGFLDTEDSDPYRHGVYRETITIGTVKFNNSKGAYIKVTDFKMSDNINEAPKHVDYPPKFVSLTFERCEKLGNIRENPELLRSSTNE